MKQLNTFLLNTVKNEEHITPEESFKNIITNNLKGEAKCTELGTYDAESLLGGKVYPGNIYRFTYKANEPNVYDTGNGQIIKWFDSYPIVLVTSVDELIMKGINLNLCNKAVKTGILNMFINIDPDFYETKAEEMVGKNKFPISENVSKLILSGNIENMLIKSLNINYGILFRHYSLSKISDMRLIEYWQWKYLPFLNYNGTIKGDILKIIQQSSGMNNYKM